MIELVRTRRSLSERCAASKTSNVPRTAGWTEVRSVVWKPRGKRRGGEMRSLGAIARRRLSGLGLRLGLVHLLYELRGWNRGAGILEGFS